MTLSLKKLIRFPTKKKRQLPDLRPECSALPEQWRPCHLPAPFITRMVMVEN
jgi:hypothetical protein